MTGEIPPDPLKISFCRAPLERAYNAGGRTDFAGRKFKPNSARSILQALSCRFSGCNLLVCVFLAFRICLCFAWFKNPPPDFFQTGSGAFPAAPSARAFDATTHPRKKPPSTLQKKVDLDYDILLIKTLLDYSPNYQLKPTKSAG